MMWRLAGELAGQNTLTLRRNAEEIEEHLGIGKEGKSSLASMRYLPYTDPCLLAESARILAECRAKLFEARKAVMSSSVLLSR